MFLKINSLFQAIENTVLIVIVCIPILYSNCETNFPPNSPNAMETCLAHESSLILCPNYVANKSNECFCSAGSGGGLGGGGGWRNPHIFL